jgi:transglutaminase-like putative cysteine protease
VANKRLGRKIFGWSTIGFWLVMVGLLIQRQNGRASFPQYAELRPAPALEQAERIASEEAWMGVYFQGNKVGWLHHVCEPTEGGYVIREESLTSLKMMDIPQRIWASTTCRTDPAFALTSFAFRLRSDVVSLEVSGKVQGKTVLMEVDSGGKTRQKEIRLSSTPYLFTNLRPYLVSAGLEAGRSFRVPVVLPSTLSQADAVLTVEAKEELQVDGQPWEAFRIRVSYAGMDATTWCDPQGRILKEVTPMGLTMLREDAMQARMGMRQGDDAVDITSSTMVPVEEPLEVQAGLRYLRVLLEGVDLTGFEIEGGRQRLRGSTLEISREDMVSLPGVSIPVRNRAFRPFVEPTLFLQSDDEKIRNLAREIIGQEKEGVEAARLLMDWTYQNLEKRPTVSVPSALDVLEERAGDCNEHATLMAALGRAVGIPAKVVVGLVHARGGFYYHAWNEVWVGTWVSLDPVMDQFPADVTHLKFIEGGLEEQIRMAQVIGRLSIDVLEYR